MRAISNGLRVCLPFHGHIAAVGLPSGRGLQHLPVPCFPRHVFTYLPTHGNIVRSWSTVVAHGKANGHKRLHKLNKQSSSHVIITQNPMYTQQQQPNVSACICKQAKLSRCHGDAADRPCELGYDRPTNQQTTRHSAAHHGKSFSQRSQHQKEAPRCLDNFPATNGGGRGVRWARIMLRLRSADREPANPFSRSSAV